MVGGHAVGFDEKDRFACDYFRGYGCVWEIGALEQIDECVKHSWKKSPRANTELGIVALSKYVRYIDRKKFSMNEEKNVQHFLHSKTV